MCAKRGKCFSYFFVSIILLISSIPIFATHASWQKVKDGLFVGVFQSPIRSKITVKDALIYIVKIGPNFYNLKLLCASEHDNTRGTAKEWCEEFGLLAAINPSILEKNYLTSTGLMKNYDYVNNSNDNPKFGAIMAFRRCANFS